MRAMTFHTRLVFVTFLALLSLILVVLDTSYQSRVGLARQITAVERLGCHRGLVDRHDNAEAWYLAYLARHDNAQHEPKGSALFKSDTAAAATYLATATSLNSRTFGSYSVTFPPKAKARPLGTGHLNCAKAFPWPRVAFLPGL